MRARIYDPIGPWWLHLPLPLLGALLCVVGFVQGRGEGAVGWLSVALGLGLLALSRVVPLRIGERDARLELGPGWVSVREAGVLTQRVVATRVRAASTAQIEGGYAVALECPGRGRHPLVLKVESPSEVERLCDALGVGYYGVGVLSWPGGGSSSPRLEHLIAWGGVMGCALLVASAASPSLLDANLGLFALAVSGVAASAIVLLSLALERLRRGHPCSVELTKTGLDLSRMALAFQFLPYHLIEAVDETPDAVELILTRPYGSLRIPLQVPSLWGQGGAQGDVAAFAAQLRTAARRSRGDRAPERGVSPSVETLGRQGDSIKTWLERLEATAQAMRAGSIYRGAAMSARELRDTLDNHDADPQLRAAAARVLVRIAPREARPRVDAALATLRDPAARRRLRLLTEADEVSLEELEELEAREAAATRRAKEARGSRGAAGEVGARQPGRGR